MKVAIYARYSSNSQREASIEDQIRECKKRIEAEGWSQLDVAQIKPANPKVTIFLFIFFC